jgi:hypothetical protein
VVHSVFSFLLSLSFIGDCKILVAMALENGRWVRDIKGGLSSHAIVQYLHLWDIVEGTNLTAGKVNEAIWHHTTNSVFSVKSMYNMFFMANAKFDCAKLIWKSKAPMKYKFLGGSWYTGYVSLWATFRKAAGLTMRTALCAALLTRPMLTYSYIASYLIKCGTRLVIGPRQTFLSQKATSRAQILTW